MLEKWSHRADLAETAMNDRHASRLWGIPRTNLAVVAWPPTSKDKLFIRWHYWWQAHYLDCLLDAYSRRSTNARRVRIQETMRGIRWRNRNKLVRNRYYDDKAWLALALGRAEGMKKMKRPKQLEALEFNILSGIDGLTGVLPWRTGETFYNVPSNGPAAIMMARTGRLEQAMSIVDWILDTLINDDGLIMDGLRMRMHGPELVRDIHPYCQGVPIVRTYAPLVAGMSGMRYRVFITFNVLGGLLWGGGVTLLGAWLGQYTFIRENIEAIFLLIVFLSVLPGIIGAGKQFLASRRR